jgi:hypothetical protein
MQWGNDIFRVEIDEVVGNENTLDLGSSVSIRRKFIMRQVPRDDGLFEPIPYWLANLIFCQYVLRFDAFYDGLPFKQIRFLEHPEKIGEIFDAEVTYSFDVQKNTYEQQEFTLPTFSLMGGKRKQFLPANVDNAIERYVKSGEPVDYKMLGWDGKKFNGVEIEAPEFKFMVPAWYPAAAILPVFIRRLRSFVGTVNSVPFYGFMPSECKYLGPDQSWVTRTVETGNPNMPVVMMRFVELQHHFQGDLAEFDVKIGDITVPEIPGFAYVDVHYEESLVDIGDGNEVPLAVPKQVDVVKVCEEMNFWDLFNGNILGGFWGGPMP